MARRTMVVLTDDVDGSEAVETVVFGLDGVQYEIDLSEANAAALRRAAGLYIENGRRTGGRRGTPAATVAASAPRTSGVNSVAVRAWARAHGIDVPARGRVKAEIVEQFLAAGN